MYNAMYTEGSVMLVGASNSKIIQSCWKVIFIPNASLISQLVQRGRRTLFSISNVGILEVCGMQAGRTEGNLPVLRPTCMGLGAIHLEHACETPPVEIQSDFMLSPLLGVFKYAPKCLVGVLKFSPKFLAEPCQPQLHQGVLTSELAFRRSFVPL